MEIRKIEDISTLVKKRRKELNLTQAECATFCGVGNRFLSELENGKESIHLGKALQVIRMLGLNVQIIENESNEKP
jgi:y4mF family transcriptional regulator